MIKKLAKYGNSTALVIDKAILELFNMNESSEVKLHTDGKSLIITPISTNKEEKTPLAHLNKAIKKVQDQQPKQEITLDDFGKMKDAFSAVFSKHVETLLSVSEKMSANSEFQAALEALTKTYDPETQPEEYIKEFTKLKSEFFPEGNQLDNEVAQTSKAFNNK